MIIIKGRGKTSDTETCGCLRNKITKLVDYFGCVMITAVFIGQSLPTEMKETRQSKPRNNCFYPRTCKYIKEGKKENSYNNNNDDDDDDDKRERGRNDDNIKEGNKKPGQQKTIIVIS